MRVLVTGGAGFLGTSVVRALREAGDDVVALGRAECDLGDAPRITQVLGETRPEAIVHLAWYARPGTYQFSDENLTSLAQTIALYRLAKAAGCRRFVGAGTCMEYGWAHARPVERVTPCAPTSLYGASKLAAGQVGARIDGISFAWARFGFLFGPRAPQGRLVGDAIAALLAGKNFRCSAGDQVRDFQHVDDAAAATVALLRGDVTGPVNIGSGSPTSVRDLIELVATAVGGPGMPKFGERAAGEASLFVPDLTRLTTEVGWRGAVPLAERLAATVESARSAA